MSSKRSTFFKSTFRPSILAIAEYIRENSPQNGLAFMVDIQAEIEKIKRYPTANTPEKFLPTKRNWYRRRIYKKKYRIIYKGFLIKI